MSRLAPLAQLREPYLACHRAIVKSVLAEHFEGARTVIELGAGLGQLSHWLPKHKPGHWIHTDPDVGTLKEHQERFPDAHVVGCAAERLPFESESCSVVIATCVLDLVPDLDAALSEIRRVLEPGGRLVHLLDLTAGLETLFREVSADGGLVLPNLFGDPCAHRFPEDVFVSEREPMQRLLVELERRAHPLPRVFGHYFKTFDASPFDASAATRAYDVLSRTPDMREMLASMLASAYAAGSELGLPPQHGSLRSSGRHFAERLAGGAQRAGLTPLVDDVRFASSHAGVDDGGALYRSLVLGHERRLPALPTRLLSDKAALPRAGDALFEAGVHAFVARR